MIKGLLSPFRIMAPCTRSESAAPKFGNVIDGRAIARDIKTLLKREVKIWAERTLWQTL